MQRFLCKVCGARDVNTLSRVHVDKTVKHQCLHGKYIVTFQCMRKSAQGARKDSVLKVLAHSVPGDVMDSILQEMARKGDDGQPFKKPILKALL